MNEEAITQMKDGVKFINAALGEIVDSETLIAALKSGKVSSAGINLLENEFGIYHYNHCLTGIYHDDIAGLKQMSNIILTSHIAFHTDKSVSDIIECGLFVHPGHSHWSYTNVKESISFEIDSFYIIIDKQTQNHVLLSQLSS